MTNPYDLIFRPKVIRLESGNSVEKKATRLPIIILLLVALTYISVRVTDFDVRVLAKRGHQFFVILEKIFVPDFKFTKHVWTPLFNTIQMSVMGSFVGCILALPFSVLNASNIMTNKTVLFISRIILSVLRTLPTLVMALIATLIFNLGTFAGTVAIALFTLSMVTKMMYEYIETVDMGAYEAAEALGATKTKAFVSAILPQILPSYLSTCLYCVETTVRHSAVLGYVGAGGIGLTLSERISLREYHQVGTILFMLFVAVVIIENTSKYLRKKLA
jgi:phosphonate transport system permease protein